MKFKILADGCTITAVISDGFGSVPDTLVETAATVETALLPEQILTEYILVGGELVHVGPKPGPFMRFDVDSWGWRESRTLPELKAARVSEARDARASAEFGPFSYSGMTFDGDVDAQRRLSVLASAARYALAAGHTFTKAFTLADNSVVELTAEDFVGIEMAKLWQVDEAFQVYRAKKAAIEAATTVEELEAITI